jgi:tetratricopeptide (TPR) repeat protein
MSGFDRAVAIARQIQRERAAAKPFVSHLQSNIELLWDSDVPPERRTAGFVLELTKAASDTLESNPDTSGALAKYAIVAAASIAPDAYPAPLVASITADAWKELANAHRYVSEYDAALRALSAAEKCIAAAPSADWERTLLRFARAVVLCDMQRFDEAGKLAEETSSAFENYREFRRSGHALLLNGMIAHRQRRFDVAASIFTRAIDVFERTEDLQGLASAYNNFGYSKAENGEMSSAAPALQKALSIFDGLDLRGEAARTRCILAFVLLRTHRYELANELLTAGRRTFRELGMTEEDGVQGLVQADVLLALGRPSDAKVVITTVLDEFRRASLNERAIVALAYVREMVDTPRAREAVALAQRYVDDLRHSPEAVFLPLRD